MIHYRNFALTVTLVILLKLSSLNSFINFHAKTKSVKSIYNDFYSHTVYNSYLEATSQTIEISSPSPSPSDSPCNNTDDIIQQYYDEIVGLRGTPELVDRLENLANTYPGIELNINLYRAIYPFKLDDFQIDGLAGLINGKNMIVSTPTGIYTTLFICILHVNPIVSMFQLYSYIYILSDSLHPHMNIQSYYLIYSYS